MRWPPSANTPNPSPITAVIADDFVMQLAGDTLMGSLQQHGVKHHAARFNGECCRKEIDRLGRELQAHGCRGVIGVGGGKTLDTAKAVAHYQQLPVVLIPTIASTDAPTSALSVLYTEQGEFAEYLIYPRNPDMVVMDSAIIAKAPVRLLVAGMGDALSTYFEARPVSTPGHQHGRRQIDAGGAQLARLCYDTLLAEGVKAKLAVEAGVVTEAVERIIEANTYLSGIGFESSGLAAAHAIHNGFTVLEVPPPVSRRESGVRHLAQLVLQNSPMAQIETVLAFCHGIGLPITLAQMGVTGDATAKIMAVAEASCATGETIHNMPFKVAPAGRAGGDPDGGSAGRRPLQHH